MPSDWKLGWPPSLSRRGDHLQDLKIAMRQDSLGWDDANQVPVPVREAAVEGALEDGVLSLNEENALAKYADCFSLFLQNLERNGVPTGLVQAAVRARSPMACGHPLTLPREPKRRAKRGVSRSRITHKRPYIPIVLLSPRFLIPVHLAGPVALRYTPVRN